MTEKRGGGSDALATLTRGSVARTLLGLSAPMVIGLFSVMAFNLTDTYFVSQLGTRELAAMTFTFPVVSVLYGLSMGMGTGTVSIIARAIGRGETSNVRRVCSDSLMLSFIIVLVVATAGVLTIDPLFRALGATDEILPLIHEYMVIWYPGVVFLVVPMVANAAIRASGDTRMPALIMTGAMTLNVLLDPIMIFGLFGFPRMELAGAAWATVVARACTMIASLAILHFRLRLLDFSPPGMGDILHSWRQLISIAIPASLTNIMPSFATGIRDAADRRLRCQRRRCLGRRVADLLLRPHPRLRHVFRPRSLHRSELGGRGVRPGANCQRIQLPDRPGLGTRDGRPPARRRAITGDAVQ